MVEHEAFQFKEPSPSGKIRYWGECACGFVGSMVSNPAVSQEQVEQHIEDVVDEEGTDKRYVYAILTLTEDPLEEQGLKNLTLYDSAEDWQKELGKMAVEFGNELPDLFSWAKVEVQ